ncbi:hypothetical protein DL768_002144 [Monosporascus sp. mg162]|nr:hypothetical protein DL768_002144 [Monosporascus sp. mg162]
MKFLRQHKFTPSEVSLKSFTSSSAAFATRMAKLKADACRLATSGLRREGFFSIESDGSSEISVDRPEGTSDKLGASQQQDRNPQSPRPARGGPTTFDDILATMDALTTGESSRISGKSMPMRIITRTQKEVRLGDTAADIVTRDPYEPSMTPAEDCSPSVL